MQSWEFTTGCTVLKIGVKELDTKIGKYTATPDE